MIGHKKRQKEVPQRRTFSSASEDTEINHKVYRALLALFFDNLNLMVRTFGGCVIDLEEHPRVRVSIQQQRVVDSDLGQISQQMMPKLMRESWYRNAGIRKEYQCFISAFKPFTNTYSIIMDRTKLFVSLKASQKTQFRLKNHLAAHAETDHIRSISSSRRFTEGRTRSTVGRETYSSNQPPRIILPSKINDHKAFQSQQLHRHGNLAEIAFNWGRKLRRRGSLELPQSLQVENAEQSGLMGEEVLVTRPSLKREEWQIEAGEVGPPVKTSFSSSRVCAIKNRGVELGSGWPLLRNKAADFVSVKLTQGYHPLSRCRQKALSSR